MSRDRNLNNYGQPLWGVYLILYSVLLGCRVPRKTSKLGWKDSNLRMSVPKTDALPLGDTPKINKQQRTTK